MLKELLKPRTVFTCMFYGTLCYLIIRQMSVPDTLQNIVSVLLGYWFGSKKLNEEVK